MKVYRIDEVYVSGEEDVEYVVAADVRSAMIIYLDMFGEDMEMPVFTVKCLGDVTVDVTGPTPELMPVG